MGSGPGPSGRVHVIVGGTLVRTDSNADDFQWQSDLPQTVYKHLVFRSIVFLYSAQSVLYPSRACPYQVACSFQRERNDKKSKIILYQFFKVILYYVFYFISYIYNIFYISYLDFLIWFILYSITLIWHPHDTIEQFT